MPIYSNLYSNLARQGFAKTLTHGYAQSAVAAYNSSLASQQIRPGFNRRSSRKLSSYQFQNAFQAGSTSSGPAIKKESHLEKASSSHGGLDAYFDAWSHQQAAVEGEKEWTQYQFTKSIEWTASQGTTELKDKTRLDLEFSIPEPSVPILQRSLSANAADSIRFIDVEDEIFEKAALAKIDAALNAEIKLRAIAEAEESSDIERTPTPSIARQHSPALSLESGRISPFSTTTSIESVPDAQSLSYAGHLTKLADTQRYAEIPAVFEAMLVGGIKPTAPAYNSLLAAAIHLPAERVQVVPKALDVYSDMLKRRVAPDTETYNTLLQLLSSRSLEVSALKRSLELKRTRFGGMEEPGKFMFASNELDYAILSEDDRLGLALKLFDSSMSPRKERYYPADTYFNLISACADAGRVPDMVRLYEHMEASKVIPVAATFSRMITGFASNRHLSSAVECYNEYKALAVAQDYGHLSMTDRQDSLVYASVIGAYIDADKIHAGHRFYAKILESCGVQPPAMKDVLISEGFVRSFLRQGNLVEALRWASKLDYPARAIALGDIASAAADANNQDIAITAFSGISLDYKNITTPAMALLAMSVRAGDVTAARSYWEILSHAETNVTSDFIEPSVMYAVALIGSGQVEEGLVQAQEMFGRIRASLSTSTVSLGEEIDEAVEFVARFMAERGIVDPRIAAQEAVTLQQTAPPQFSTAPITAYQDNFDPYAASTDFRGSALIVDELERGVGGRMKSSRLDEALARFKNIRRAGRHARYITYAKLISAAARDERTQLVHDILGMARSDVPLLPQYRVVHYGWVSILDAMVGACLTLGDRALAAQYHQELLDMGASPTANTFGLYITTLKESIKTFDEASEAVKIFLRAKSEGVEPSSFLYNALIGKLGKARRIDDCLFYFAEMRSSGIRPTSVTYGTIVNALCRVSDEKFAEELFEEMESMPNYKARPAPYNSMMQFFLSTKRDKAKVLAYYERMKSKNIQPTPHTYKLLVDTHATLEPVNMAAAEAVLDMIRSQGQKPEAVHYSSLIHAKGCVMHDMAGARAVFDAVIADRSIRPQACLYQALFEAMVANHNVAESEPVLRRMSADRVDMTPYIANTLIHGWANESNIAKSMSIFDAVSRDKREPSTYEAMTRAYLAVEDRQSARDVVQEMMGRGYPSAVSTKILELVGGSNADVPL